MAEPTGDEERCPREAKDCSCQDGAPNPVGTRADLRADTEAAYLPRLERQSETAPVPAPPDPNQQVERWTIYVCQKHGVVPDFIRGEGRKRCSQYGCGGVELRRVEVVPASHLHHSEQLRAEAEAERDQAIKLQRQLYEDTAQARSAHRELTEQVERLADEWEERDCFNHDKFRAAELRSILNALSEEKGE